MAKQQKISWYEWIQTHWERVIRPEDSADGPGMTNSERISIFIICYLFAVAMWSLVNLGREFELTLSVPVTISNVPSDLSLKEKFLKEIDVTVSGDGWMLMNIFNAKPVLDISLNSDNQNPRINLYEYMRREISAYPNLNLTKVEPAVISLDLDEKISKKVPIKMNLSIEFKSQYNFVDNPRTVPDSITLTGSKELLKSINYVETATLNLVEWKDPINQEISLINPSEIVELDYSEVQLKAKVSEYTEGEIRVFIKTDDLPRGISVKYSPAVITIRYDVPIEEYESSQDLVPYSAFVNFKDISADTTGFVTPGIKNLAPNLHLKIRSYQPKRVSYYNVIMNE